MRPDRCETCAFWLSHGVGDLGHCSCWEFQTRWDHYCLDWENDWQEINDDFEVVLS